MTIQFEKCFLSISFLWPLTAKHLGHIFLEPFWNENTWNGFLARFVITCSRSGIVRMVVYVIPHILLFGAEWIERAQVTQAPWEP